MCANESDGQQIFSSIAKEKGEKGRRKFFFLERRDVDRVHLFNDWACVLFWGVVSSVLAVGRLQADVCITVQPTS